MKSAIDLALFQRDAHNPSIFSLTRSHQAPERELVDFCVPCNPYFPTPEMFAEYARALPAILKYYPSDNRVIGRRLADTLGLEAENVVLANGSTELISWIDTLLVESSLATPIPTFGRWTDQPAETGKRVCHYPLRPEDGRPLPATPSAGTTSAPLARTGSRSRATPPRSSGSSAKHTEWSRSSIRSPWTSLLSKPL